MQILEIYIHTIHIHSYTYIYNFFHHHHHHHPHHPHHRGQGGTDTFIYIHIKLLPPPPPTTTHTTHTTGGRGVHHHPHHPHHRGEGGTGALLYRPITMGWGGGVPSDAGPYIYFPRCIPQPLPGEPQCSGSWKDAEVQGGHSAWEKKTRRSERVGKRGRGGLVNYWMFRFEWCFLVKLNVVSLVVWFFFVLDLDIMLLSWLFAVVYMHVCVVYALVFL